MGNRGLFPGQEKVIETEYCMIQDIPGALMSSLGFFIFMKGYYRSTDNNNLCGGG